MPGPASLPLLQFTAQVLWDRRDRSKRQLQRAAYEAVGGVAGALAASVPVIPRAEMLGVALEGRSVTFDKREVPSGGLPTDAGCLVQNVGTAAAIHDWLQDGEPLISRITTITGDGIARPMNVRARIGTPVAELVEFAGGYTESARHLVIGGPMTGKSVSTDRVPLVKAASTSSPMIPTIRRSETVWATWRCSTRSGWTTPSAPTPRRGATSASSRRTR